MTRSSNPEYEAALKLWSDHRFHCSMCQMKNYCPEGQEFRIAALKLVSSTWRDAL